MRGVSCTGIRTREAMVFVKFHYLVFQIIVLKNQTYALSQ